MMGYNPYPYPGEYGAPAKKKGAGKFIAAGGVLVLITIAVLVMVLTASSGGGNTGNQSTQEQTGQQTTSNAGADVVKRPDGTLDLSQKVSSSKTLKAQVVQAKEKEQINLSSGFSFMVNGVEDYVSPNPTTKPGEGKKFVVATIVVGNRNTAGNISVSYLDFRLRDKGNQLIPGHITTNEILNNPLSNPSELKPGEQINGKIVFEVASADKDWVLRHTETYQKTTDNTTFNVEGEVVVSLSLPDTETDDEGTPDGTPPAAAPATTN